MITVDDRQGSVELAHLFKPYKVQTQIARLEFGDFSFVGRGPEGVPALVGVERKTVGDFVSSMKTGRFTGHQLPGLLASYSRVWLLIEGYVRPDIDGHVYTQYGNGKWKPTPGPDMTYTEFEHYLLTLEEKASVKVRICSDSVSTVQFIASLYHWWNDKDYDQHRSHLNFYNPVQLRKPTLVRRVAKEFAGVGWERSKGVAAAFKTVESLATATVEQWKSIDGIGERLAQKIWNEIRGIR